VREIYTDGSPHPDVPVEFWLGDSHGRWEGATLVDIKCTSQTWFDRVGNFHSDALHGRRDKPQRQSVVRSGRELHRRRTRRRTFTLIDQDTMHYQVTINDPNVYARPWTMAFPLRRNNERGFRLLEEACHEGERNTDPLITLGYKIYPGMNAGGR